MPANVSANVPGNVPGNMPANLFHPLPSAAAGEVFTQLLSRNGVRVERIVSAGQSTPPDAPFDQPHDEWVLLLRGRAGLWLAGAGEHTLRPGDHLLIPAGCVHRVTWTAPDEPTVWLAVHVAEPGTEAAPAPG